MEIKKDQLYKVQSDEKTFGRYQELSKSIMHLATIVQNDMVFKGKELEGWLKAVQMVKTELEDTILATQKYLAQNLTPAEEPELKEDPLPDVMKDRDPDKKAKITYKDLQDDDEEVVAQYVTDREYDELLQAEAAGAIEIIKHPSF